MDTSYNKIESLKKNGIKEGIQINDVFLLINSYLLYNPQVPENMDTWMWHELKKPTTSPRKLGQYLELFNQAKISLPIDCGKIGLETHFRKLSDLNLIEVTNWAGEEWNLQELYSLLIDQDTSCKVFENINKLKTENVSSDMLIHIREWNPYYRGDKSFMKKLMSEHAKASAEN